MMDHSFFSSGVAALKLIYHHHNDKVSGESLNNYIYTRTFFFFISCMVQFLQSVVTVKNGSFADLETFILKIQPGKLLDVLLQVQ